MNNKYINDYLKEQNILLQQNVLLLEKKLNDLNNQSGTDFSYKEDVYYLTKRNAELKIKVNELKKSNDLIKSSIILYNLIEKSANKVEEHDGCKDVNLINLLKHIIKTLGKDSFFEICNFMIVYFIEKRDEYTSINLELLDKIGSFMISLDKIQEV